MENAVAETTQPIQIGRSNYIDVPGYGTHQWSFITPEREAQVQEDILSSIPGGRLPLIQGFNILLKLHVRTKVGVIDLPAETIAHDQYQSCTGLVLKLGPDVFTGKLFEHSGPRCKVGDWVRFKRLAGCSTSFSFKRTNLWLISVNDDCIDMVIEDPLDLLPTSAVGSKD